MGPFRRSPSEQPDSAAFLRYVSGESPLAESEAIRAWAGENPDRLATLEELRAAWSLPAETPEWNKSGIWDRLSAKLAKPQTPRPSGTRLRRRLAAHRRKARGQFASVA